MPPDDDDLDIGPPDPEDDHKESELAPDEDDEPRKGGPAPQPWAPSQAEADAPIMGLQFDDEPPKGLLKFDDEPVTAGAVEKLPDDDEDEPPAQVKLPPDPYLEEDQPQEQIEIVPDDDYVEQEELPDDDKPRKVGLLQFDDEPVAAGAVEELPDDPDEEDQPQEHVGLQFDDEPPKAKLQFEFDDEPANYPEQEELPDDPDEELPPTAVQNSLEEAESLVNRSRLVSNPLFKEARRMPEYGRVLATRERCAQFERKLLRTARMIDSRLGTKLPADTLDKVVERLANRFAAWEHSPRRQKERQRKQALKRRRHNRGRDLRIVRYIEDGEPQRKVADRLGSTRWVVQHVLQRDAQHLLKRNKPPRLPD